MSVRPVFISSGDLIADRRYQHAEEFRSRGDLSAAADLFAQAAEQAPGFAAAWFALGETRERLGEPEAAADAFTQARLADPPDRLGAGLRLARLGVLATAEAMTPDYVRAVFDQYAPQFDRALVDGLGYRAPQMLLEAVTAACVRIGRPAAFTVALDLGCGTGLAGEAFAPLVAKLEGVDLSPAMVELAARRGRYESLVVGDMLSFVETQPAAGADLVLAADAFVYVADLGTLLQACARALAPQGLLAFTLETHEGQGVELGEKLRFAHGESHVRIALAAAGIAALTLSAASTRQEAGKPVPGLLVVAARA